MQSNRSDPSALPGDHKLSEQALLKETDLQRRIESLQCIISDLLIENEKAATTSGCGQILILRYRPSARKTRRSLQTEN